MAEDEMMKSRAGNHSVRPLADVVGVTGSVACAMHCLMVPLSLVFGQVAPISFVDDEASTSAIRSAIFRARREDLARLSLTLALSRRCRKEVLSGPTVFGNKVARF